MFNYGRALAPLLPPLGAQPARKPAGTAFPFMLLSPSAPRLLAHVGLDAHLFDLYLRLATILFCILFLYGKEEVVLLR